MQFIGDVKIEARVPVGVDQGRVDIDERAAGRGRAIGARERVVVIDLLPAGHAIRRACGRHIDQPRRRIARLHPLGKNPEARKNLLRRIRRLGVQIVAPTIIDHDLGFVDRHELIEARELVSRARTAKRAVQHRQRRHLVGHLLPLAKNAAADEKNSALHRRLGQIRLGERLERRLVLRPTFRRVVRGVGKSGKHQTETEKAKNFHWAKKRMKN